MAGEAEQVAAVVHEFMHVRALDNRGCALLRSNELDAEQANETGEDDPGKRFTDRDSDRAGRGSKCGSCHVELLGDSRPHARHAWLQEQV
jgi:hypothetical protein